MSADRRRFAEQRPQASQCAEVAHAGGRGCEAEGFGRFAVAHLFDVPEQDDFTVLFFELVECGDLATGRDVDSPPVPG